LFAATDSDCQRWRRFRAKGTRQCRAPREPRSQAIRLLRR